ncbi:hypothetical protein ABZW18_24355 [Streptomyces sp. NPDC004647]|uniref:hypothetical protein n=1 Tax=Streptomyces sp. NPDC004647 TaxID=3154671 RepID=UPI0033B1943C
MSLILVATGCSTAPVERPQQEAPAVPAITKEEARSLALPFDAYEVSTADIHTIESAEDILLRDCMRDKGMDWQLLPRPRGGNPDYPNRRRYGVIEPRIAAEFGYHAPPESPEILQRKADWDERIAGLQRSEQRAAYGKNGVGGCWEKAHERLLQNVRKSDHELFNQRIGQNFDKSQRDAEVVKVFRAWSTCMKKEGFSYTDPLEAIGDPQWEQSPRPSSREIDVAEEDVRCKRETDLVATWNGAESAIQKETIRSHADEFRALKARKQLRLEAARRILEHR